MHKKFVFLIFLGLIVSLVLINAASAVPAEILSWWKLDDVKVVRPISVNTIAKADAGYMLAANFATVEDPVNFADPNLKAAVEEALGITDPTPTDMLKLNELIALGSGIVNPAGIEYADNLQNLTLRGNQIRDVSALSGLTNLQNLTLGGNQISDVSALSGLTNLQSLGLMGNQISDVSALSGLTNLQNIMLGGNQISDVSALSGLTNLRNLNLYGNQISDVSALSGLTNLSNLILYGNQISDVSALSSLTNLQNLMLVYNQISDISPLVELKSLANLDLIDNPLDHEAYSTHIPAIYQNNPDIGLYFSPDPSPLNEASATDGTYSDKVQITWGSVQGMMGDTYYRVYRSTSETGVKTVLGNWQASTIFNDTAARAGTTYYYWVKAKTQDASGNYVETDYSSYDTGWFGAAESPVVFADSNLKAAVEAALGITEPTPSDMLNLITLSAEDKGISSLVGIEYARNLTVLVLRNNQISDISTLSELTNLRGLALADNQINDISPLIELENLTYLNLRGNPLDAEIEKQYRQRSKNVQILISDGK